MFGVFDELSDGDSLAVDEELEVSVLHALVAGAGPQAVRERAIVAKMGSRIIFFIMQ